MAEVEARARITLLLPTPATVPQFFLVDSLLDQLTAFCGGVTTSPIVPPQYQASFSGRWFDTQTGQTVTDANVFVFGDALIAHDAPELRAFLAKVKLASQREFEQDIIWITVNPLERIVDGDYSQ